MRRRRSRPSRTGNTNSVPSGDRFSSRGPWRTQAIVPESWFQRDSCAAHPQERYVVGPMHWKWTDGIACKGTRSGRRRWTQEGVEAGERERASKCSARRGARRMWGNGRRGGGDGRESGGGERGASHVVLLFGSLSRKTFVDGMPGRKQSIDRGRSDVTCRPQSSSPRVSSPRIGSSTVNFGSLILDF
ncbi:hypothetical protein GW17_00038056 [Ensete ventricosum]|nr:hypothetical protein GW17_00038056 [Ensete ventricosum]